MIRILILLMALNALFTPVSIASVCSPNNMGMPMSSMAADTDQQDVFDRGSGVTSAQVHCDNCNDMQAGDRANMDCDADCGVSCAVSPVAAMTSTSLAVLTVIHAIKPVSGTFNIYTRSISPELQPPLV